MTLKREEYATRLAKVETQADLEQAVWDADDWELDMSPPEAVEGEPEPTPTQIARARQAQVNAPGFEFKVNPDAN